MASVQLTTTTFSPTFGHGHCMAIAGSRLWVLVHDGADLVLMYSDDDGGSWSAKIVVSTADFLTYSLVYDATNSRLNVAYAGYNGIATALNFRAITSNVASGVPGALTTATTVDAGGANLGVMQPYLVHTDTASNPRYWIIGAKATSATTIETRVWFVTAGTSADTAANWSTTNFTDLGANSNASSNIHYGMGAHWTVGGAEKLTFVLQSQSGGYESVTFDPTAATPTPGSTTSLGTTFGTIDWNQNLGLFAINAQPDYLVWGVNDLDVNQWTFRKTVDGTTWTDPSGWSGLAMGRCQIARTGSDFALVYSTPYGLQSNTDNPMEYRTLDTATDALSAGTAFSDSEGNNVTVPINTGTTKVYAVYRNGTASPFSVRSDQAALIVTQKLRPDADVTTTGWTTTPLWSKIEEETADGTVITATAA